MYCAITPATLLQSVLRMYVCVCGSVVKLQHLPADLKLPGFKLISAAVLLTVVNPSVNWANSNL